MSTRGVCVSHSGLYNKLTRVPSHPRLGARRETESLGWCAIHECLPKPAHNTMSHCAVFRVMTSFLSQEIDKHKTSMHGNAGQEIRAAGPYLISRRRGDSWRTPLTSHSQPVLHYPLRENFSQRFFPGWWNSVLIQWMALLKLYRKKSLSGTRCLLSVGSLVELPSAGSPCAPHWLALSSGIPFPSGDGQMSQVRKLLTSSPQQLSGWLSSKFCSHNKHPSDLAATQWASIWSGGSCSFSFLASSVFLPASHHQS